MSEIEAGIMARNCVECGSLFLSAGPGRCRRCMEREDHDFESVRAFLRSQQASATVEEIHERTGVDRGKIVKFLRDGRLVSGKVTGDVLSCEVCGRPVHTGRLCESCLKGLQQKAAMARTDPPSPFRTVERVQGRMYTQRRKPR